MAGNWDRDDRLRWLRVAAGVMLGFLLVWLVVIEDGPNDVAAIGTVLGGLMVVLGFAELVRRPK